MGMAATILMAVSFWQIRHSGPSRCGIIVTCPIILDSPLIKDMAIKFGAKIVDGFDVDTIRQEGELVRVTSKAGLTHSAPSLGINQRRIS